MLLQQFSDAEAFYNKATGLSKLAVYGAKEEALEKQWNERALHLFTALYKQIPTGQPIYDSLRFQTSFKIGELQHYFENFSEAVSYYGQAIAIKEKSILADSLLFKPLLYAGIILYNQNKFDTAIRFFKRAEIIQATYGNQLPEAERLYNILGVLHYERGNYKQAQNYFQKALALLPAAHPYYNELFVNYKINLAQLHMRVEEYDKAYAIYEELLPRKVNLNEIYHNIGSLHLATGNALKALFYFRKVHYQNNKIIKLYNGMAQAFSGLSLYDSALVYYQKAIAAHRSLGINTDAVGYGLALKSFGDYQQHFKNFAGALRYYQQAIHQFYPAFRHDQIGDNPEEFSGVFSYINLFTVLNAKAAAWHAVYLQGNDRNAAQQELAVYQSAFGLIDYVERTYESDEARLFLTETIHTVHDKPIMVAFDLYGQTGDKKYLSLLYAFDQQNKAAVLALNRQINTALAESRSPEVQKERYVKGEITRLSIRAAQITDSVQLANLNNSIRDYEIELGKLQENGYAKKAAEGNSIPSLDFLQTSLLDAKTALVSYHLSSEKLTTFVVTKKDVRCHQQSLPKDFANLVQQEILSLKTLPLKPVSRNRSLYTLLLANVPLGEKNQLIIIPDDVLAYFSFESLQNEKGRFLIQDVAVQYQFSTALLAKNETDFSDAETLSFAPFATQSYTDSLSILPASAKEIEGTKGKRFFDTAATKEAFLAYSNSRPILHLATHAVVNNGADNFSYIAFARSSTSKENLLYAQEIYNLRLEKTALLVLSACETGTGSLVKGEGVLSLSRAFAYAGCPNVITSLWKADDFSTAYLTTHIHRYLSKGYSIATATQQAKIDYLSDRTVNPRLKQPYYWSHLVFVGAYSPEKNGHWRWPAAAAVALSLLICLIYKRKSRGAGR